MLLLLFVRIFIIYDYDYDYDYDYNYYYAATMIVIVIMIMIMIHSSKKTAIAQACHTSSQNPQENRHTTTNGENAGRGDSSEWT